MIPRIFMCKNCGVLFSLMADPDEPMVSISFRGTFLHARLSPGCAMGGLTVVYPEHLSGDALLSRCIVRPKPAPQDDRRHMERSRPEADPACFICAGLGVWIGDPCSCVIQKGKSA